MYGNRLLALCVVVLVPGAVRAQESYSVAALKEAPPAGLAAAIQAALNPTGYRIVDGQGKVYAEVWLRKEVPATGPPSGPKGTVQFPVLAEGELLGALRFRGEGHDYRDQTINAGMYTMRYGVHPVNGDHLGVSPFRDYVLLSPATKDVTLANLAAKKLHEQSAEAAGTSHPAVFLMRDAPASVRVEPSMAHDEAKNTWGIVVPLSLAVPGASGSVAVMPVQIIVVGAATI